jgi:polar amino acid transport system substrate-binding protein
MEGMTTRKVTLLAACLVLLGAPRASAEEGKINGPEPEPKVEFFVANFPPYAFTDAAGSSYGFFVDAVNAMAKYAGHYGSVDVVPWKRAQKALQETEKGPKLIFPLIRSPERENIYRWVAELYVDDIVLLSKKDGKTLESLADARGLRVGVVGGSALLPELKADKGQVIEVAPDIESCAKLLKAGRIDAWYVSKWVGLSTLKHAGISKDDVKVSPAVRRMSIFLGASMGTSDKVVEAWSQAFEKIKADGSYEKLLNKWRDHSGS